MVQGEPLEKYSHEEWLKRYRFSIKKYLKAFFFFFFQYALSAKIAVSPAFSLFNFSRKNKEFKKNANVKNFIPVKLT